MLKAASNLALIAFVLSPGSAAFAQATGSIRGDTAPISVPEGRVVGDPARAIMDKFAACVVRRHHSPVIKSLQMEREAAEQYEAIHKLLDAECWGGNGLENQSSGSDVELTAAPFSYRAALFKAVIKHDFAAHPVTFISEPTVAAGLHNVDLKFADCVVRSDPAAALRAVVATAGSSEEAAAVGALGPQMSDCVASGLTLSFTKVTLLAYLAEAYFLEAEAAESANGK